MKRISIHTAALLASCALPVTAFAQTAPAEEPQATADESGPVGDIIVTARKRSETSLQTPVVLTAVSGADLESRGITSIDRIASIVPQLVIGGDSGSQGGTIALRGISGPAANSFGDQAVAFNIDGVPIAKSAVRRMSEADIAQIEVLKGPQALFYGKNSPGGIITIRTADPTSRLEAKLTGGYEFEDKEKRIQGYVSAPLSDTLGLRVSAYYSKMDGWIENTIPATSSVAPFSPQHLAEEEAWSARATLKWEPTSNFSVRAKFNYSNTETNGAGAHLQKIRCTSGTNLTIAGSIDDCTPNGFASYGAPGAALAGKAYFGDGTAYGKQSQILGSIEANLDLGPVTLTSVSGVYRFKFRDVSNYAAEYALDLASFAGLSFRQLSQEFRAVSDYDGPLNFSAGAFISDDHSDVTSVTFLYATQASAVPRVAALGGGLDSPANIGSNRVVQDGRSYSAYMQLRYNPIPVIELDVGGRYSNERKNLPLIQNGFTAANGKFLPLGPGTEVTTPISRVNYSDFSPEVTASYKPNPDFNLFASYKHGFLSGGFNVTATVLGQDITYKPEVVKGFECGLKAALFDRTLRVNLAAYTYTITDQQVTVFLNARSFLKNAASGSVKGIEGDFTYQTPLEGLRINGSLAYNDAKFTSYPGASCAGGMSAEAGCTLNGGVASQNLTGRPLPQSAKWTGSFGMKYDTPLGSGLKLGLSADTNFSSSYFADAFADPRGKQPKYALLDASARLSSEDDTWQIALIGSNLTNRHYWSTALDTSFTSFGTGRSINDIPAPRLADKHAAVSRGRQIMLQLSYKFGG